MQNLLTPTFAIIHLLRIVKSSRRFLLSQLASIVFLRELITSGLKNGKYCSKFGIIRFSNVKFIIVECISGNSFTLDIPFHLSIFMNWTNGQSYPCDTWINNHHYFHTYTNCHKSTRNTRPPVVNIQTSKLKLQLYTQSKQRKQRARCMLVLGHTESNAKHTQVYIV